MNSSWKYVYKPPCIDEDKKYTYSITMLYKPCAALTPTFSTELCMDECADLIDLRFERRARQNFLFYFFA